MLLPLLLRCLFSPPVGHPMGSRSKPAVGSLLPSCRGSVSGWLGPQQCSAGEPQTRTPCPPLLPPFPATHVTVLCPVRI